MKDLIFRHRDSLLVLLVLGVISFLALVLSLALLKVPAQAEESPPLNYWFHPVRADFCAPDYLGGAHGAPENNVLYIDNAEEFALFASEVYNNVDFSDWEVILTDDIDLSAHLWYPVCIPNMDIIFDGGRYTISGLTVVDTVGYGNVETAGLFGVLGNSLIRNLTLEGPVINVDGDSNKDNAAGVITGISFGAQIRDVLINNPTVQIKNCGYISYLGGVAGCFREGDINNSTGVEAVGAINGAEVYGGRVRLTEYFRDGESAAYIGGVAGANIKSAIVNTAVHRTVLGADCGTPTQIYRLCAGGIVGYASEEGIPSGGFLVNNHSVAEFNIGTNISALSPDGFLVGGTYGIVDENVAPDTSDLDARRKSPVVNKPGAAVVTYNGSAIDLSTLASLFKVDVNAGTRIYTIEEGTSHEAAGTIGTDNKTLSITAAGTFLIGLVTAETSTHSAGAPVTAVLTVNKGNQAEPTGLNKTDETKHKANDGAVSGVSPDMEYGRSGDTNFTPITGTSLVELAPGTYFVRYVATENYNAGSAAAITILAGDPEEGVIMAVVEKSGGAPETILNTPVEPLSLLVFLEEEMEQIAGGEEARIFIVVSDNGDAVDEEDKALVSAMLGDFDIGLYLDISVFKQVGDNPADKMTALREKISLSFEIPEGLDAEGRVFKLVRVHNGDVEVIKGRHDYEAGLLSFETDRFSAYALVYVDLNVILNKTRATMGVGKTLRLSAHVSPDVTQDVLWDSSDPAIATVDDQGIVTAVNVGTVVITAKTAEGGQTAICTVDVRRAWDVLWWIVPAFVIVGVPGILLWRRWLLRSP
ncbi:MAG: Ig-like domain-containing protein [Peptococcaceae bacterium]|nr:Ig-like domain-containing protein [Peptococcaceae bacterium]